MSLSREELAAFADGKLEGSRARAVEAALAADPALRRQLERHRELKARLAARFDRVLDEPLPPAMVAMLSQAPAQDEKVVSLAEARVRPPVTRALPRWSWVAGPALAASLALVILAPRGDPEAGYADPRLARVLDEQLVASQSPAAPTRVLVSFRTRQGAYCRAFSGREASGIACRDDAGWKLQALGRGDAGSRTDYRMAGADAAAVLAQAQAMADGGALDAAQERAARARGWR
jgi:anti-sigma factor RsiW